MMAYVLLIIYSRIIIIGVAAGGEKK